MKTILKRKPGFFTVTNGFVSNLGPEWPDKAEVTLKKPRAAIVYGREKAVVIDGGRFDDALAECEVSIASKRVKAGIVGRAVGRFGDSILYERSADLCAEGCEDVAVLPEPSKYVGKSELKTVHMRLTKSASGRRIEGLASTPNVDRDYDVVDPHAFDESLKSFMANNPMMLLNHDPCCPLGKILEFEVRAAGFWVAGEIAKGTMCADETWALIQQDVLRTFSVQFIILEREIVQQSQRDVGDDPMGDEDPMDASAAGGYQPQIRKITKAELIEVSVVSIPCNREAVFSVAKSLKNGTDVSCAVCKSSDCECAESRAVVEYRQGKIAPYGDKVEKGRDPIIKALGRDADRLAVLVAREGVAQFKHHGMLDGDLVVDPVALRCAIGSIVAYTDQGGEALTEAERRAAYHHLARHCEDAAIKAPALGKGPRPEGIAEALAGVDCVLTFAKDDGFERQSAAETWLKDHGLSGVLRDGGQQWVLGARGHDEDRNGSYAMDKGVLAVVYRQHVSKETVPVNTKKENEAQPVTAVPPATPAVAATTPPAAPVAAPAIVQEPEGEREVEIDDADWNALRLAAANSRGEPSPGLTRESLEHALTEVEFEPA
jgi:HK97 family phage prohead protease